MPSASLTRRGPAVALALLIVAVAVGTLVYPTYPNYDSYYSLLWGREILHLHLPTFDVYRAPTEHPLSLAFGAALSLLGRSADRVMVLFTMASLVVLAVGMYRLGKAAFTPLIGLIAAGLLITRFDFPFLAARAYIDIPYLAFVIWAAALEVERPRRGMPVLILLALASLMRPEAWLLAGLYVIWIGWHASWRDRFKYAAIAAAGPLIWVAIDTIVTGHPLFSLTHTSGLAEELGRNKGALAGAGGDPRLPQVARQGAGAARRGRRAAARDLADAAAALMPLLLLVLGLATFFMVGVAGLSIINRYLLVPSLMIMIFAAVAVGGWSMLRSGAVQWIWAGAAILGVVGGVLYTTRASQEQRVHREPQVPRRRPPALVRMLDEPKVRAGLKCGPLSVPNHKLIPEARWILRRGKTAWSPAATRQLQAHASRRRDLHDQPHGVRDPAAGRPDRAAAHRRARADPACGLHPHRDERLLQRRMPAADARALGRSRSRWLLVAAFLLRIWGIKQGLPYAYNADENAHFVPKAIALFGHGWNPHYFVNPPAYTYVLHVLFDLWFGGRAGVSHAYATNQTEVFVVARVASAVLGTVAVGLLYLVGARLVRPPRRPARRRAARGRVPAGLLLAPRAQRRADAGADLPLAVGDGADPARRRPRQLRAGRASGLGLACATKYTGGIVLLPLLRPRRRRRGAARSRACALAGALSIAAVLRRQPVRVHRPRRVPPGLRHQSQAADDALGKLGLTQTNGAEYYLWTFTWGLGWVPALAAIGGAVLLALRDRRGVLRARARADPVRDLHGHAVALLRPLAAAGVPDRAAARRPTRRSGSPTRSGSAARAAPDALRARRRPALRAGAALLAAPRAGALAPRHAQPRPRVAGRQRQAAQPDRGRAGVPDSWAHDLGHPYAGDRATASAGRSSRRAARTSRTTDRQVRRRRVVNIEDYERELQPGLIDLYEQKGYC